MTRLSFWQIRSILRPITAARIKGNRNSPVFMAMVLGAVVTVELLIMGAMFLNVDFQSADRLALLLGAVVLYFGVVALLTDK